MNLKEAFRYQNFLSLLEQEALYRLSDIDSSFIITERHLRKDANPDAENEEEEIMPGNTNPFYPTDCVLAFVSIIIDEKEKLMSAITEAKSKIGWDFDALIATNKSRRRAADKIKNLLAYKPLKKATKYGTDYNFNVEGVQVTYRYKIETIYEDNFNREIVKEMLADFNKCADEVSSKIDTALITTLVNYNPPFDVNATFADIMDTVVAYHYSK